MMGLAVSLDMNKLKSYEKKEQSYEQKFEKEIEESLNNDASTFQSPCFQDQFKRGERA